MEARDEKLEDRGERREARDQTWDYGVGKRDARGPATLSFNFNFKII